MLGTLIILLLIGIAVVQYIRGQSEAIGNWVYLFPELEYDPENFYSQVDELLKVRNIPNIRTAKRNIKEYGVQNPAKVPYLSGVKCPPNLTLFTVGFELPFTAHKMAVNDGKQTNRHEEIKSSTQTAPTGPR